MGYFYQRLEADRRSRSSIGTWAVLFGATKRWAITCTATAVSTYALDAVATMAGVLLVATEFLSGLDHGLALSFLAGTYIVWWAGLRVNLTANWALLEDTGTSTNALSKAAYDLLKVRGGSLHARKIAAGVGYAGTELAKEAPYYAGAFGAALLTDSVTSNDALVFLGGANLGAAAYEYALAHLVQAFLHRREQALAYASFETDWSPKAYLCEYYRCVEADERWTIPFFVSAIKDSPAGEPVLLFGAGPTLHHVFLAVNRASEIHLCDYLATNLREIERWIRRETEIHDWRPFVRYTLECEGIASPTEREITEREETARAAITRLLEVDIRRPDPLDEQETPEYGTVISAYCADSATADRDAWETYTRRIVSLLRPGGTLLIAALRHARGYSVGGKTFPSPNVDENDVRVALQPYFQPEDIVVQVAELPETASKGYEGIILASAHRRRAEPVELGFSVGRVLGDGDKSAGQIE